MAAKTAGVDILAGCCTCSLLGRICRALSEQAWARRTCFGRHRLRAGLWASYGAKTTSSSPVWSCLSCTGPALTGHTARLVEDGNLAYMLSFGGKAAGGTVTNLLWRINLTWAHPMDALYDECGHQFLEWRLLLATGRTPSPRYCHSAVELLRGCMIFGGWAQGQDSGATQLNQGTVFLSDLHVLELPSMSWVAPDVSGSVPRGRCQSVMVAAPDEELVLVFGGACHHDPKPGQAYGDMVMDLFDVVLLHVPTMTWLPLKGLPSNYQQRGGTNTLIRTVDGRCFVFGGMNSDEGCNEPNFLNDLTELVGL